MNDYDSKAEFEIRVNTAERADIYLSVSQRADSGQGILSHLVNELDQARIRAVSVSPGESRQSGGHVSTIMKTCNGLVAVLPYLRGLPEMTSPDVIRDIHIALSLDIPVFLLKDSRVEIKTCLSPDGSKLQLRFPANELPLEMRPFALSGPFDYDEQIGSLQAEVSEKLHDYVYRITQRPRKPQPYGFLAVRLQRDFEMARRAMIAAVEDVVGIPCLWFDDNRHTTNIEGARERTRLLIKHASFVIADPTYGPENPTSDSPNRAHEIGMAIAYCRPVILCCRDPRRTPYFCAGDMQMIFWKDEQDLYKELSARLRTADGIIVRRVYNRELIGRKLDYRPQDAETQSVTGSPRPHAATNKPLSAGESWIVAIGFGMVVLALSLLSRSFHALMSFLISGAILAATIAVVFSSNLNRGIQQAIARVKLLRWAVPIVGLILLLLWAMIKPYRSSTEYQGLQNTATKFSEANKSE